MNKQEKLIVGILVLVLMGWFAIANRDAKRRMEYERRVAAEKAAIVATNQVAKAESPAAAIKASETVEDGGRLSPAAAARDEMRPPVIKPTLPERTVTLSNGVMTVTLTSKGGGVKSVELLNYNESLNPDDGKVRMNFAASPSLALTDIPGLGARNDFDISVLSATNAVISAATADGLKFERTITLGEGYAVGVADSFKNTGATVQALDGKIALGAMGLISSDAADTDLAIDARVRDRGKFNTPEFVKNKPKGYGLASLFGGSEGGSCASPSIPPNAPTNAVSETKTGEIHWIAARERFFVQVLTPEKPVSAFVISATREASSGGAFVMKEVGAALAINAPDTLAPEESVNAAYTLFIGPRRMSELRALATLTPANGYTDLMRFGVWSFFCRPLLDLLNFLYKIFPNYGVAIILLTFMVRLLLFPINRKNAESMKKMKEVQPLLKEVQTKFKNEPQKLQQETMRIYRENKVNPLASCLPMLIQLPIFIALFTVLRSAVELRYASFLWIADLSSPENLFSAYIAPLGIPMVNGLNILPITMAATMALQTKLTPAAGDPAQQKMMMIMMPVMMLVMLYNFAAALGLYWTVSQTLAILGLMRTRFGDKKKKDGNNGDFTPEPPRETRQMRRERERAMAAAKTVG